MNKVYTKYTKYVNHIFMKKEIFMNLGKISKVQTDLKREIWLSLLTVLLTVLFSTCLHGLTFGVQAIWMGVIFTSLLLFSVHLFVAKKSKTGLILYGIIAGIVVLGHGIYNGFWNHFMKVSLFYLHNQQMPDPFAKLFAEGTIGSFWVECFGILTFVASIFAAIHTIKLIKVSRRVK